MGDSLELSLKAALEEGVLVKNKHMHLGYRCNFERERKKSQAGTGLVD